MHQSLREFTATAYILEERKILLLPHAKIGKWLPPGGHIEKGETPIEAVKREVLEETGLVIELIREENLWMQFNNAVSLERPYMCLLEKIPAYGDRDFHEHIDLIYVGKPSGGTLFPPARWFSLEEIELLKDEVEIFTETKTTIRHLFEKFGQSLLP